MRTTFINHSDKIATTGAIVTLVALFAGIPPLAYAGAAVSVLTPLLVIAITLTAK